MPGVASRVPVVEGQALASSPFSASGVLVRGMRGRRSGESSGVANNIQQGTLEDFDEAAGRRRSARGLPSSSAAMPATTITLISPRGAATPFGTTPRIKAYKVAAIFEIGMSEFDAAFVFMPLPEAQAYFNRIGDVDRDRGLRRRSRPDRPLIRKRDRRRPAAAADLHDRLAPAQRTFFNALEVERNVMFLILTLIVLVAALNIVSGLIMLVKDKGRTSRSCAPWARRRARSCASS